MYILYSFNAPCLFWYVCAASGKSVLTTCDADWLFWLCATSDPVCLTRCATVSDEDALNVYSLWCWYSAQFDCIQPVMPLACFGYIQYMCKAFHGDCLLLATLQYILSCGSSVLLIYSLQWFVCFGLKIWLWYQLVCWMHSLWSCQSVFWLHKDSDADCL